MANSWFRMYAEFATDPKVQMMPEAYQRRLLMLFCFRCNVSETLHDEEVVFQLRISPDEWAATKAEFVRRGFIDMHNNLLNWDKRQFVSDTSTARVREFRERKKQADETPCNVSVTPPEQNRTDTEQKDLASQKNYSFCGKLIRLTADDYERLKKTYPNIPDFDAELFTADSHYAGKGDKDWWHKLPGFLNNSHQRAAPRKPVKKPKLAGMKTI